MTISEKILSITQLKQVVKNSIDDYNDMISKGVRVIGLEDKLKNRLETLSKIQTLLVEHEDVKTYETTCAGCGEDLPKEGLTEYCCNCM